MNKKERLSNLVKKIKDNKITAYEISSNTSFSIPAIQNIIDGVTESPRIKTIDELEMYLNNRFLNTSDNFNNSPNIDMDYLELLVMKHQDELLERPFLKSKINELVNKQIILTLPKIVVDLHKEWEEKNNL